MPKFSILLPNPDRVFFAVIGCVDRQQQQAAAVRLYFWGLYATNSAIVGLPLPSCFSPFPNI